MICHCTVSGGWSVAPRRKCVHGRAALGLKKFARADHHDILEKISWWSARANFFRPSAARHTHFLRGATLHPPLTVAIVSFPLVVYSLWRSTYWVVKHSVRETNWSFRWLYSEKNAAKDLLKRFPSHSGTVTTKLSMFFLNRSQCPYFGNIAG